MQRDIKPVMASQWLIIIQFLELIFITWPCKAVIDRQAESSAGSLFRRLVRWGKAVLIRCSTRSVQNSRIGVLRFSPRACFRYSYSFARWPSKSSMCPRQTSATPRSPTSSIRQKTFKASEYRCVSYKAKPSLRRASASERRGSHSAEYWEAIFSDDSDPHQGLRRRCSKDCGFSGMGVAGGGVPRTSGGLTASPGGGAEGVGVAGDVSSRDTDTGESANSRRIRRDPRDFEPSAVCSGA